MSRQLYLRHRSTVGCTCESLEQRRLLAATISGAVLRDISGNGLSADDTGLSGVTVKLYKDLNANGKLDATDGAAISTKVSAAGSGSFSFTGLSTGKYIVQDVPSAGQVRTWPYLSSNIAVNVTNANGTYGNNKFTNYVKDFNPTDLTNISYTIVNSGGTKTVTSLQGNVKEGDVVTANFTVKAGKSVEVTLVSYMGDQPIVPPNLGNQEIFDIQTGTFGPGQHSLTVVVADCYFQVDFIGGKAIVPLGPTGSNILYGVQGRLLSFAVGGDNPCEHGEHGDEGRMTGGGSVFLKAGGIGGPAGSRITHGFQLHCAQNSKTGGPIQDVNNRLEINWNSNKSKFHLENLSAVQCFETELVQAPPKSSPIDTLILTGNGRFSGKFNNVDYDKVAARVEATLTDAGEPGTKDTSDYRVIVLDGNKDGVANDPVVVLDTKGALVLDKGNHQAHLEITPLVRNITTVGL